MIKKMSQRGFTLIELLVVIAIIGILASVVLASLNTARAKGADAAAKSDINNMRSQAGIVYDNAGDYAAVCADTSVAQAVSAAATATGAASCSDDAAGWAIETSLKAKPGTYYCVDSTGAAGEYTGSTIAEGSDYTCG